MQGRIQRFLKGGGLYVDHHGWPLKKILGFRWSKAEVTLETISFLAKHLYQFFQILSIFIDKILSIFQNFQRFHKERQKTLIQQSMRKVKLRKVGLCVITGCFIKPFKMIINLLFLLFIKLICSAVMALEIGNGK